MYIWKVTCFIVCTYLFVYLSGQELKASVTVKVLKETSTNTKVYRDLEKRVRDFLNVTKWTSQEILPEEKIEVNVFITILEKQSNSFVANLQIQSRRPIFGSTYYSPIINLKDNDFNFDYIEFQKLIFNPTKSTDNLVAVLSYYAYLIIGMDADTFSLNGGDTFFEIANNIVSQADNSKYKGWSQFDGQKNRYTLIRDILSDRFSVLRRISLEYHLRGLDLMYKGQNSLKSGKEKIGTTLMKFQRLSGRELNSYFLQLFFQTKADEIVKIFSGGPPITININELKTLLRNIQPSYSDKWEFIKR